MVRSLFSIVGKEVRGMHQAAYLLAAFAFGSQLLALVRDRLLASTFGASHTLDLYYIAFRIPDFLFATCASLLSLYALLPVLTRLEQENEGYMVSFLRQALLLFFIGMGAVSLVVCVWAPELLRLVSPGVHSAELVVLVRILLLQPILLGASNIVAALTQLRHRFFLYAVSPLLYNLGIIFGIVALYPSMGIIGLGWGVVSGALLHVLVQLPYFFGERATPSLAPKVVYKELISVLMLSVPRTLALSAGQLSLLSLVAIASYFAAGSVSVFMFAFNLQAVPLTIIGVSYSVAAFPTLARLHAAGERVALAQYLETALRHMFFWSIPATVFVVVLRAQLVRVILGGGAFGWDATRLTAAALALCILSLAAQSVTLLIARAYYAAGNTKKPLYFGVIDVVVSVCAGLILVQTFLHTVVLRHLIESWLRVSDVPGTVVLMLSLGFALGSILEFVVGYIFFVRDFAVPHARLTRLLWQSILASLVGGAVTYQLLVLTGIAGTINTTFGLILQGLCAGFLGIGASACVLALLRNEELFEAVRSFSRRVGKSSVSLEVTDISS